MPETAKIIDAFVAVFGKLPSGRVTENGHTVTWGKRFGQTQPHEGPDR